MTKLITTAACAIFLVTGLSAQISQSGHPYSLTHSISMDIQEITMPSVDTEALLAEDAQADSGGPLRFGYELPVAINLRNAGNWLVMADTGRLWRVKITGQGALSISLTFDDFYLPENGELFVYSPDGSVVLGAYTQVNNKEYRKFSTLPVPGESIIIEYHQRDGKTDNTAISIGSVIYGYRNVPGINETGDIRPGACQNNVACPEGTPWTNEIRSVARTLTQGWLCSGSLLNNTSEDGAQYFLTAYHCVEGLNTNYTTFLWNYQASTCTGSSGPQNQTVTGGVLRASSQDIYSSPDFALIQISTPIPDTYNVFYSGWTRSTSFPQQPVGIHHPDGAIKKISFDYDAAYGYNTWKWNVSWDDGTTEPGSSGSPLYDADHRVVGDLSTGCSACNDQFCPDQYGKFNRAWNYGSTASMRLMDWLDPTNTDVMFLDGYDPFAPNPDPVTLGDVNSDELINIQDIILVVGIILGTIEPDETMLAASDVNEDGVINVLDIISIAGMILGTVVRQDVLNSAVLTDHDATLSVTANSGIAGIQMETSGNFTIQSNSLPDGWQILENGHTILIFNTEGISLTSGILFTYSGELNVESAIAGDWTGRGIVMDYSREIPTLFVLHPFYPNPFNPVTTLNYSMNSGDMVNLSVYDVMGRMVSQLVDQFQTAGDYHIQWNGESFPSGLYFAKLTAGGQTLTMKLVLMK